MQKEYISIFIFLLGATCALVINIFLLFINPEVLGEFNKTYAFFIIFSHFFLFSINENLVRNITILKKQDEKEYYSNIFLITCFAVLIQILMFIFLKKFFYNYIYKYNLEKIIDTIQIAIPLFIINKIFFSFLNGKKKFFLYFILGSMRPFLILVICIILYEQNLINKHIGYSFIITEILLILINFLYLKKFFKNISIKYNYKKIIKIINFCILSWPHSFLSYSFLRIDILCISFFFNNYLIGIYSFAAMFIEGLYQLCTVARDRANPEIAERIYNKKFKIKYFKKNIYTNIFLVFISFISIKFIVLNLLAKASPENLESIKQIDVIFSILCFGLFFYSGLIVFENIFIMANKPKLQSYFIIFANILNIILTIIFINLFGMLGAAYATSFTFVMLTIILNLYARKIQYNK